MSDISTHQTNMVKECSTSNLDFCSLERVVLAGMEDLAPQDKLAAHDVASGVPGHYQGHDDRVAADICGAPVIEHGFKLLALCPDSEGLPQRRGLEVLEVDQISGTRSPGTRGVFVFTFHFLVSSTKFAIDIGRS